VGTALASPLFLVLLTLKLCHVIDWSWWWVTAPLWAPLMLALCLLTLAGILIGLAARWDLHKG
jgi:hypothetical protein